MLGTILRYVWAPAVVAVAIVSMAIFDPIPEVYIAIYLVLCAYILIAIEFSDR